MYRFRGEGLRCLLCAGQRCPYFEEIIVPMRMSRETTEAKARADKKDAAVKTYLLSHDLIAPKANAKRMCLDCRKVEVRGRQQFCYNCAKRRKQTSYRCSKRRRRSDVQKLAISPVRAEALTNVVQNARYNGLYPCRFSCVAYDEHCDHKR
jgi:hypothetical protein